VRWSGSASATLHADAWQEDLVLHGAEVKATYLDGPGAGNAAVTRHAHGTGHGWYISTRLDAASLGTVMTDVYADAGVAPSGHPAGLEVVVRRGDDADYAIAVNHRDDDAPFAASGVELLTGAVIDGEFLVPAGGVAVVRIARTP
jgi:beta-galactosidase